MFSALIEAGVSWAAHDVRGRLAGHEQRLGTMSICVQYGEAAGMLAIPTVLVKERAKVRRTSMAWHGVDKRHSGTGRQEISAMRHIEDESGNVPSSPYNDRGSRKIALQTSVLHKKHRGIRLSRKAEVVPSTTQQVCLSSPLVQLKSL